MNGGATVVELEALYRTRYRSFLRVARLVSGDATRAHDAVQEGFAAALKGRRSYRGSGSLEAWVWRSVVRAATRERPPNDLPLPEDASVASSNGSAAPEDAALRVWVAGLPERQRLVVFLRYYADLDYRSIAAVLGVEVGTVSATLSAAHTALRRALQEVPR